MSAGFLTLVLLAHPCPPSALTTSSATRTLDLGETELLRSHVALGLLADVSSSLGAHLEQAGFQASPRGAWRLYYRALPSEEAVSTVRALRTHVPSEPTPPSFEDHLDALLHVDRLANMRSVGSPESRSVPIVLARLGARPAGLAGALDAWLGPEPAFRPQTLATPRRRERPMVSLFDDRGVEDLRVGLVFTSTTELGLQTVEAVATAVGDGPLSRLGRALRPFLSEETLTSLAVQDATASAFSIQLGVHRTEGSDLVRVLGEVLRSLETTGLLEKERGTAIRRARGWRSSKAVTPRGRIETQLLDHLRFGRRRSPSDFDCLKTIDVQTGARALGKLAGLRLLVEGDIPPGLAAELARQWPKAEIVLHAAPPGAPD